MINHDDIDVSRARGGNLLLKIGDRTDIYELVGNDIDGNRQPAAVRVGVSDQLDKHKGKEQRRDEGICRGLIGEAKIIDTLRGSRFDQINILGSQHLTELLVLKQL